MASTPLKQTRSPSLRTTAAGLGVALSTLQNAIATGRVSVDAEGRVPDLERARAELAANTAATHPASAPNRVDEGDEDESLASARRRKEAAAADLKELELARLRAEVVPARDVERRMVDVFTSCKTHLLALPSRAKQALPHLSHADLETLDALVREALEELADGGTPRV